MRAKVKSRRVEVMQYTGRNWAACEVFSKNGLWILQPGDWLVKYGDDDVRAYGEDAFELMFEVIDEKTGDCEKVTRFRGSDRRQHM
jgi:hypothetical protein